MDLSLATTSSDQEQDRDQEIADADNNMNLLVPVEKEHMFDKVVTPSDVGKLNRLVIPKQHAEKYFPLDSSSSQNGTLLNFQDRNGKMWRFRYSYWNSSQSYVMTKGWSRFVKEKKLDAGDIVSFQRGVGTESAKLRLFIDWRHRPDINLVHNPTLPPSSLFRHHNHHHSQLGTFNFNFNFPTSVHGNRLPEYSVPRSLNFGVRSNMYHQQQHQYYRQEREIVGYGYGSFVGRCWPLDQRNSYGSDSLVIDSVPVVPGRMTPGVMVPPPPPPEVTAVGKRLRLFGVNMECGTDDYHSPSSSGRDIVDESGIGEGGVPRGEMGASASSSSLRLSFPSDDDQYAKKGKSLSSFSLDLNP